MGGGGWQSYVPGIATFHDVFIYRIGDVQTADKVCVCACACVRACVRACVYVCERVCVAALSYFGTPHLKYTYARTHTH